MNHEPKIRAGRAKLLRKLPVVAVAALLGILLAAWLITDLGRGVGRDIRTGLFAKPDWVLHLHRPDHLLSRAAGGGNAPEILSDPNWRWLLGLPEGTAAAADDGFARDFLGGELLLAVAWPEEGSKAAERVLAAFRPQSTTLPRLLQLARSRWVFERLLAPHLPAELTPTWVEGAVLLATTGGSAEFYLGSSRDLVVAASRLEDLQTYLRAHQDAPEAAGEARDSLRLSARAREQLRPAIERVLGREVVAATAALGRPASTELAIEIAADGPSLSWRQQPTADPRAAAEALGAIVAARLPEIGARPLGEAQIWRCGGDAAAVTALLKRIEQERRAAEEKPEGERREELRKALGWGGPEIDDATLAWRLAETRTERLDRLRREMACWHSVLARGFDLSARLEGEALDLVLRLVPTP